MSEYADRIAHTWAHVPIRPLEELRVLPEAGEYQAGIYFLWRGDELLYIGRSRNLPDRIQRLTQTRRCSPLYEHPAHKAVPFERHTALVLSESMYVEPGLDKMLQDHERAYINKYRPPYNIDRASGRT
jgi:hypothetical protein